MVFGQSGAKESIERSVRTDLTGRTAGDIPPAPPEAMRMLTEAQENINDRSLPFHRRMQTAIDIADKAAEAFPDVPQVHLFRGNLRYQNLDHHIARLSFERCRELIPGNTTVALVLARILMEIGDSSKSGELIDEVFAATPDDSRAFAVKAEWHEKQGHAREAADILIKLIPEVGREEQADLRATIGRLLLDAEDPSAAVEILEPLIEASTQSSSVHRIYGDALSELDRNDHALDAYRAALHHNPGDIKAHFNMGVLLREMGFGDKARPELEIVVTSDPSDPDAHLQLFELAREKGNKELALEHALKYLISTDEVEDTDPALLLLDEIEEFSTRNVILYSRYLIESGEPERAVKILEPFAANEKYAPPFEVLLSQAYMDLDDTRAALDWTAKALDRYVEDYEGFIVSEHPVAPDLAEGGEFAELVCQQAELLLSKGEINEALEALEELGEDDSLMHEVLRIKGEACFLRGQYDEALEKFHAALVEHPADVDTLASLGATYRKMGNIEFAINYYLRAHLNDADDLPTLRALAGLLIESGRNHDAGLFLMKYLELEDEPEGIRWANDILASLK